MALISPSAYGKLEVGTTVEVRWLGTGKKTTDTGALLYAYARRHPVTDENGKITGWSVVPSRCGIDVEGKSIHYTNAFELWI